MSVPPVHLCSFGTIPEYTPLLDRLRIEATASGYFASFTAYTQETLPVTDAERAFILANPRGYGYWTWKVILLLDMLSKVPEGDIVLYVDAGCGIRTTPKARECMNLWIHTVLLHPTHRVAFQLRHLARHWTKMDIFQEFHATDPVITDSGQHMGGIQIYQNTTANRMFLQLYRQALSRRNYRLVDDSPSIAPNFPGFVENRHDQAILSVLYKKLGVASFPDHCDGPDSPVKVHCQRAIQIPR